MCFPFRIVPFKYIRQKNAQMFDAIGISDGFTCAAATRLGIKEIMKILRKFPIISLKMIRIVSLDTMPALFLNIIFLL